MNSNPDADDEINDNKEDVDDQDDDDDIDDNDDIVGDKIVSLLFQFPPSSFQSLFSSNFPRCISLCFPIRSPSIFLFSHQLRPQTVLQCSQLEVKKLCLKEVFV